MEKRFDILQTIRRMAPKHAATAAVFRDTQQLAYGVLTNVSVTGACIVTDSRLDPGSNVDLRLSFYQQPRLYEIAARVIWNRRGGAREKGFEGLQLHGVEFTLSSALQKSRLCALLAGEVSLRSFAPPRPSSTFSRTRLPVSSTSSAARCTRPRARNRN